MNPKAMLTAVVLGGAAVWAYATRAIEKDAAGVRRFKPDARTKIMKAIVGAGLEPASGGIPGVFFMRLVQNNPGGVPAAAFINNSRANGLMTVATDNIAKLPGNPGGDVFVAIGDALSLATGDHATMAVLA